MASRLLQLLPPPNSPHSTHFHQRETQSSTNPSSPWSWNLSIPHRTNIFTIRCSTNTNSSNDNGQNPQPDFPNASSETTTISADKFPIEKRRRSEILRQRKPSGPGGIVKPEPPNFEIGWKRTKHIKQEKPTGYVIMDFLEKLEGLMGREFGSTELLAKAGEIVAERSREEAEVLRDEGKVEDRMVTELFRVLKLMEMDLAMVKAAVKQETLAERLEQAKARCRQAILVANSF